MASAGSLAPWVPMHTQGGRGLRGICDIFRSADDSCSPHSHLEHATDNRLMAELESSRIPAGGSGDAAVEPPSFAP